MSRTAVVLYNLGGPDRPESVRPFLFNLFNDPAIIRTPAPLRWCLAQLVSRRRAPVAREIYAKIGGSSPILAETERQAAALRGALADLDCEIFVAMRYWHPMADAVAARVAAFRPETVILLPLYPQFSTTTTGSFLQVWRRAAAAVGLKAREVAVCCYPEAPGFVEAAAALAREAIEAARGDGEVRVLFSAHGLPKKFVDGGDPYRMQVERTVAAVLERLAMPGLDSVICFQSRVGPLEWIRPYTEDEIVRGGREGRSLVVVPIAFVSEHSETLVELDIEYGALARRSGAAAYHRVAAVGDHPAYIGALAELVRRAEAAEGRIVCGLDESVCAARWPECACAIGEGAS